MVAFRFGKQATKYYMSYRHRAGDANVRGAFAGEASILCVVLLCCVYGHCDVQPDPHARLLPHFRRHGFGDETFWPGQTAASRRKEGQLLGACYTASRSREIPESVLITAI
jgi:hypothetical protein